MAEKPKSATELILETLREKVVTKQEVSDLTMEIFNLFKTMLKEIKSDLVRHVSKIGRNVKITYEDKGSFEANLIFGSEILILSMHTNVFTFDENHFIHRSPYVQADSRRAYCGVIQLYNFLSDSFKYNRVNDIGYLIGRIFINREKHYFAEGKRQLGFLYNDFENAVLNKAAAKAILESAILYCIDFELFTPPYSAIQEITVQEKMQQSEVLAIQTGKRLGFRFQADNDQVE